MLADAIAAAQRLVALVTDLLKRNGLLSPTQIGEKTIDLIEKLEKQFSPGKEASMLQASKYPVYSIPDRGSPHVESPVPLVYLIYVAIRHWKEKFAPSAGRKI